MEIQVAQRIVLECIVGCFSYSFSDKVCKHFDYPTELVSQQNFRNLIIAAKSTGAFPVGLANQKVRIQK